jgi:hypothetical protein
MFGQLLPAHYQLADGGFSITRNLFTNAPWRFLLGLLGTLVARTAGCSCTRRPWRRSC